MGCASTELKETLINTMVEGLRIQLKMFNSKVKKICDIKLEDIVMQINRMKTGSRIAGLDNMVQEQLKLVHLNLAEVSTLLSSNIKLLGEHKGFQGMFQPSGLLHEFV